MGQLKIKQVRSIIDRPKKQKLTVKALGLGRPNWEAVHNDTPQIRGMINKVSHLLTVEELKEAKASTAKKQPVKKKPAVKKSKKSPAEKTEE